MADNIKYHKITKLQSDVLECIKSTTERMTYREIAEKAGLSHPYSVQQAVNALIVKGFLHEEAGYFKPTDLSLASLSIDSRISTSEQLSDAVLLFIGTEYNSDEYDGYVQSLIYWAGMAVSELRK